MDVGPSTPEQAYNEKVLFIIVIIMAIFACGVAVAMHNPEEYNKDEHKHKHEQNDDYSHFNCP